MTQMRFFVFFLFGSPASQEHFDQKSRPEETAEASEPMLLVIAASFQQSALKARQAFQSRCLLGSRTRRGIRRA